MVHLFASDYDGTLFKGKEIRQSDIDAIHRFREAGHKFGLCTGRGIESIVSELKKYNIPFDFVIGINGGAVLTHDQEEIYGSKLSVDLAHEVVDTIAEFDTKFYGVSDGYHISRVINESTEADDRLMKGSLPLDEILENGPRGFYINAFTEENALKLAARINDLYGSRGVIAFANVNAVDIGMKGVDKATGIAHIVDHYRYNGRVFTVGDSFNDLPMIKAYHGFVMDTGVDAVKKHADGIVSTVGEALNQLLDTQFNL